MAKIWQISDGRSYIVNGDPGTTITYTNSSSNRTAAGKPAAVIPEGATSVTFPSNGSEVEISSDTATIDQVFNAIAATSSGGLSEKDLAELETRFVPAEHATDTTSHITEEEHTSLNEVLAAGLVTKQKVVPPGEYVTKVVPGNNSEVGCFEPVHESGVLKKLKIYSNGTLNWMFSLFEHYIRLSYSRGGVVLESREGSIEKASDGVLIDLGDDGLPCEAGGIWEWGLFYRDPDGVEVAAVPEFHYLMGTSHQPIHAAAGGGLICYSGLSYSTREDKTTDWVFKCETTWEIPGALDAHASDATAHMTEAEHTGLTELLAKKDELLALLNS